MTFCARRYTFCLLDRKQERIKSTDFPTCTHRKTLMYVTKAMHVIGIIYSVRGIYTDGKQCMLPAACSNKPLHCRNFTLFCHRHYKQTCLVQGLGATITTRKRPSKRIYVHHEGHRSYVAWSSSCPLKLNICKQ